MLAASPDRAPTSMPASTVVALVAHARAVPSATREAFGDRLRALGERPDRVLIRTCHRIELYAVTDGARDLDDVEVPFGARRLDDVEAVEHFLAVACGLDSTVFGETQILHQLREALVERHADPGLDPVLDRLFQAGLGAGRTARSFFTGAPRSLADVALDRVETQTGRSVAGRTVLVVGAGSMARLASFAAARRGARVVVANRTASRAATLAGEVRGVAAPIDAALPLPDLAGILVALGGRWTIPSAAVIDAVRAGTVLVDLSSPPALPETLTDQLGARFVSVDDLVSDGRTGPDDRVRSRIERLIAETGAEYCQWLRARGSVPAIRAVVDRAEERRRVELEAVLRRLPELSDEERALLEQMTHRLVAAILHAPITALGADADGDLEPAARELFGL